MADRHPWTAESLPSKAERDMAERLLEALFATTPGTAEAAAAQQRLDGFSRMVKARHGFTD